MWHIYEYDKLKPYGFAFQGAIDGFRWKIILLNVSSNNNNPAYRAYYFIQTINELERITQVTQVSENMTICGIQQVFLKKS